MSTKDLEYYVNNTTTAGFETIDFNFERNSSVGSGLFSSVTQSCPILCDSMDYSTPGFPVHHQLPELTQTHVCRVSDGVWLGSAPHPRCQCVTGVQTCALPISLQSLSRVQLFVTPWTIARQASLSIINSCWLMSPTCPLSR